MLLKPSGFSDFKRTCCTTYMSLLSVLLKLSLQVSTSVFKTNIRAIKDLFRVHTGNKNLEL